MQFGITVICLFFTFLLPPMAALKGVLFPLGLPGLGLPSPGIPIVLSYFGPFTCREKFTSIKARFSPRFQPLVKRRRIGVLSFPLWEITTNFDPCAVSTTQAGWITQEGSDITQGMAVHNSHLQTSFVESVIAGQVFADTSLLSFRDPSRFVAGELHNHSLVWSKVAAFAAPSHASEVLDWIIHRVNVGNYFRPFKGCFKGEEFDSPVPPRRVFHNSPSCIPFSQIISGTIIERLASGAISLWGKVDDVDPPYLVMPLTVEPSKPRLCNDNRFLNLWVQDRPFSLDHLQHLQLYVLPDSFQTVCDDKSGYDHILLSDSSKPFFGFQWGGWYFTSNTIPFGWKLSAYVYHSTGLLASIYFRSIGIPCSLYIDDRHTSQICFSTASSSPVLSGKQGRDVDYTLAQIAIFVVCYSLTDLGYTIGLQKSSLIPSKVVKYLGFECDSSLQAFRILPSKKERFISLVKEILASGCVSLVSLQRLAGKCISMCLAVPGARLFTNEINLAVSKASRTVRPLKIYPSLRQEIEHWLFLETWQGFLPWRSERHLQFKMFTDASSFAWAGVLSPDETSVVVADYWTDPHISASINVKETLALANVLASFADHIRNSRVDVFVDSKTLIHAWNKQGAKSHALSDALKRVFITTLTTNCHLNLIYTPSGSNLADSPSRVLSLQDAKLSGESWDVVQLSYGGPTGHTVDLMALPSNVMTDHYQNSLPFFSPYLTPGCLGVNLFGQRPCKYPPLVFANPYVFPPICLIPNVLKYLRSVHLSFTIVVPDVQPRRFWWPMLWSVSRSRLILGHKGQSGCLLAPSKHGFSTEWLLPWDLWIFRVE